MTFTSLEAVFKLLAISYGEVSTYSARTAHASSSNSLPATLVKLHELQYKDAILCFIRNSYPKRRDQCATISCHKPAASNMIHEQIRMNAIQYLTLMRILILLSPTFHINLVTARPNALGTDILVAVQHGSWQHHLPSRSTSKTKANNNDDNEAINLRRTYQSTPANPGTNNTTTLPAPAAVVTPPETHPVNLPHHVRRETHRTLHLHLAVPPPPGPGGAWALPAPAPPPPPPPPPTTPHPHRRRTPPPLLRHVTSSPYNPPFTEHPHRQHRRPGSQPARSRRRGPDPHTNMDEQLA